MPSAPRRPPLASRWLSEQPTSVEPGGCWSSRATPISVTSSTSRSWASKASRIRTTGSRSPPKPWFARAWCRGRFFARRSSTASWSSHFVRLHDCPGCSPSHSAGSSSRLNPERLPGASSISCSTSLTWALPMAAWAGSSDLSPIDKTAYPWIALTIGIVMLVLWLVLLSRLGRVPVSERQRRFDLKQMSRGERRWTLALAAFATGLIAWLNGAATVDWAPLAAAIAAGKVGPAGLASSLAVFLGAVGGGAVVRRGPPAAAPPEAAGAFFYLS